MENQLQSSSRLGLPSTTVWSRAKLRAAPTLFRDTRQSQTRMPGLTIIPTGELWHFFWWPTSTTDFLFLSWRQELCFPETKKVEIFSETGRGEDDLKRRHRSSQSDDTSKAVKKSSSSGGGGNGGIALGSNPILPPSPLPAR